MRQTAQRVGRSAPYFYCIMDLSVYTVPSWYEEKACKSLRGNNLAENAKLFLPYPLTCVHTLPIVGCTRADDGAPTEEQMENSPRYERETETRRAYVFKEARGYIVFGWCFDRFNKVWRINTGWYAPTLTEAKTLANALTERA